MVNIIFYEKPGCLTNRRQKAILEDRGFSLVVRDLITHPWTETELRTFFSGVPLAGWFNPAAPGIKTGQFDPGSMSEEQALQALIAEPLLIRRPLLEWQGRRMVGFDPTSLRTILGIDLQDVEGSAADTIEQCSRPQAEAACQ